MPKAKMTVKRQVTIPKEVRQRLGLRPGDELEFVADKRGVTLKKRLRESPFASYRGFLEGLAGHDSDEMVGEMRGG